MKPDGGGYTPSAGVIYYAGFLQDQQFITISDEEGGPEKSRLPRAAQWR